MRSLILVAAILALDCSPVASSTLVDRSYHELVMAYRAEQKACMVDVGARACVESVRDKYENAWKYYEACSEGASEKTAQEFLSEAERILGKP